MARIAAAILVMVCLLPTGAGFAQESGKASPPPLDLPEMSPTGPEMIMKMTDLWRKLGPDSPLNAPMLQGLENAGLPGKDGK
jgi:hypothetical protein